MKLDWVDQETPTTESDLDWVWIDSIWRVNTKGEQENELFYFDQEVEAFGNHQWA